MDGTGRKGIILSMNNNKPIVLGALVLLIVGGVIYFTSSAPTATPTSSTQLDGFTQCLKDSGAIFYGAFWCPHCREQKQMFGSAMDKLPYVECSTPDGNRQTPICQTMKIESYPTWVFPNGATSTGTLSLEALAEKSGCALQKDSSPAK